jgi:hypothetical protein
MSLTIVENDTAWRQPIEVLPLIQAFPELGSLSKFDAVKEFQQYNEKKVVLSEDHDRLFGVFGKKSVVVKHEDLLDIMSEVYQKLYGDDGTININSMKDGAQVVISMELPLETPLDLGNGDVSNLLLHTSNSYDKGLSLKIQTGVMRVICTNGAILGSRIASINARELLDGFNTATLAAKVHRMVDKAKGVTNIWQKWLDIHLNRSVVASVLERRLPQKFVEPILEVEDFPINKYELYNALTRRSSHDINTERGKWQMDSVISKVFYGNYFEKAMKDMEAERIDQLEISDSEINDTVTETDDIKH